MKAWSLIAASLAAVSFPAITHAAPDNISVAERGTHIGLRSLYAVFEIYREATGDYPPSGTHLRQIDAQLRVELGEPYAQNIPLSDGWGNSYFFNSRDNELVLVSAGPNGLVDDAGAILALQEDRVGAIYRAKSIDGDDLIMVGNSIAKKSPGHRQRQMATVAEMRSLGTALEAYRLDHGVVPGPTGGFVRVLDIAPYLVPTYIKSVPARDAWQTEYLLWCGTHDCVVVSLGADREPDSAYRDMNQPASDIVPRGPFSSPDGDIILVNDDFVTFPAGISP